MSLLQMSFAGGVMILAITVIRTLAINRLPKKTFLVRSEERRVGKECRL